MNAAEAYARLQRLRVPVITTLDAAQTLGQSVDAANKTLRRLSAGSLVVSAAHGLWALSPNLDPFLLAEPLTAPFPSYVSLQSALHHHGMIDQIPAIIFGLSATRNRLFARLPELELPARFDRRAAQRWIAQITSPKLARIVRDRYAALVERRSRR